MGAAEVQGPVRCATCCCWSTQFVGAIRGGGGCRFVGQSGRFAPLLTIAGCGGKRNTQPSARQQLSRTQAALPQPPPPPPLPGVPPSTPSSNAPFQTAHPPQSEHCHQLPIPMTRPEPSLQPLPKRPGDCMRRSCAAGSKADTGSGLEQRVERARPVRRRGPDIAQTAKATHPHCCTNAQARTCAHAHLQRRPVWQEEGQRAPASRPQSSHAQRLSRFPHELCACLQKKKTMGSDAVLVPFALWQLRQLRGQSRGFTTVGGPLDLVIWPQCGSVMRYRTRAHCS